MNKQEVDFLVEQIRSIILNKPLPIYQEDAQGFADVQDAMIYLADCLSESNQFLKEVAMGNLNIKTPSRKNFLAGSLKELHAGLKHLTWQANQVAQGDYNQNVSFLGEFSHSFNKMIVQLNEREEKLKEQSQVLAQTNNLMKSIMDGLNDSIIVTSQDDGEIIYYNESANRMFFSKEKNECECNSECLLLANCIKQNRSTKQNQTRYEYNCPISNLIFEIEVFSLQWNEKLSYVNRIVDITNERQTRAHIQSLAYKDEMTGLYNRRYCQDKMKEFIRENKQFTFCMIDVDRLKYANDNFGHLAGDEYIKLVAKTISSVARSTDIVYRIGGDEFAAIFLNCDEKRVVDKMNLINTTLLSENTDYPMAISFGAVEICEDYNQGVKRIMMQSDEKMYQFKRSKVKV